jgi:putative ABC transport system ATP-binding protein
MIIEVRDLHFRYPSAQKETLAVPKFTVEQGEKVFLYGASGSGKTTLLETLAGVIVPQKGSVKILDQEITGLRNTERDAFRAEHVGYIFQSFNLIPYLTVYENITLPCFFNAKRKSKVRDMEEEVRHLVRRLGIESILFNKATDLSVGQQQRVAVARALLGSPQLILADEPTSSLDMEHREKFIQLLFDLCAQNKTSVLFVSHDRTIQHLFSRSVSFEEINSGVKA